MALGATAGSTVGLVMRNSVILIAIGAALGLATATMLARSMARLLYAISPFDLPAFTVAALVLVATGIGATLMPAFRATRVDPIVALREL
jgi:ABC-type antimicrobial peptide transport system permease subunit